MVNKWIMVVENQADTMQLIDSLLRRQCMAVIKADNAELALHLVKSMRPDAFVVNVALPDMSGLDLCRTLRSTPHTASIPVTILSAQDNSALRQQAFEAGASEFVFQSMLPEDLTNKINNLLTTRSRKNAGDDDRSAVCRSATSV